jgi:integrase/recombinase XerD
MAGGAEMAPGHDGRIRVVSVANWPDQDRRSWETDQAADRAARLHRHTVQRLAQSYGFWLGFVLSRWPFACDEQPFSRVSQERLEAYVKALYQQGYTARTVDMRLYGIRRVLQIMEPDPSRPRIVFWRGGVRTCRPLSKMGSNEWWPDEDRRLWQAGTEAADVFGKQPIVQGKFAPATLNKYMEAYSRWLAFLQSRGLLNAAASPAARVTRSNVQAYFNAGRQAGNASTTTLLRLRDLRAALRILLPEIDFRWLIAPDGQSLASLLPAGRRSFPIIDSDVLYKWGHAVMQEALDNPNPGHRAIGFRNGLLITVFAARAPRLRSMAALQIGKGLIRNGDAYRIIFEKADMKTPRPLEYDAPVGLTIAFAHYLGVERCTFLNGEDHGWLWISGNGKRLSESRIQRIIRKLSKERFGISFGPHRFRHAMATSGPLKDPDHPGIAAGILDISGRIAQAHYNRANKAKSAKMLQAGLREDRKETRSLAMRAFAKRRKKSCGTP